MWAPTGSDESPSTAAHAQANQVAPVVRCAGCFCGGVVIVLFLHCQVSKKSVPRRHAAPVWTVSFRNSAAQREYPSVTMSQQPTKGGNLGTPRGGKDSRGKCPGHPEPEVAVTVAGKFLKRFAARRDHGPDGSPPTSPSHGIVTPESRTPKTLGQSGGCARTDVVREPKGACARLRTSAMARS